MPDDLDWFFSTYENVIVEYSVLPDQWKGSDPSEQYRHWYHVDVPHDESQYWDGVLPWAVEDNFATLVQSLEDENWEHAAQLMGVISHYITDASMPLHATENYNPGGNHGAFEGTVDDHLYEITLDLSGYVPQELDNIFNSTMELLEESYGYVDVVSYYLNQDILWNDELKTIVENRLSSCTRLMAHIWYTGMVQAGLVFPPDLVAGWNLVGFTAVGENDTPANLFAGKTYNIWKWDAVNKYYVSPSSTAPVDENLGYWVHVDEPMVVTTTGVPVESCSIDFVAGWNLVHFPATNENTTPENLFAGKTYYIWKWDAENKIYVSPLPNQPVELDVGYWIYVDYDETITVPV